ncbi:signal peptidase II [Sphingomonas lacunae]|uniref:Lipoprotein signal peptidase n=1 Tax=Sphingomonas lacunae TaxID=2698828 RepID=A0A6M4ASS6_9SPHN|nr:signal peptidase II [Sphingomonas lacunae]QJQ31119.1 signal peptidase II [Sphingomonas lacunae]
MTSAPATPSPHRRFGIIIAALVLAFDQLTKWIVTWPLGLEARYQIELLPFFNLTWMENRGVSFGMFSADSDAQRWMLVGFTLLVAIGVGVWMMREKAKADVLALALVLGGALGNIIDRIRVGYVVDFADLHFGDFRPFLIFNVADACITIGVLLLVARALLVREKAD